MKNNNFNRKEKEKQISKQLISLKNKLNDLKNNNFGKTPEELNSLTEIFNGIDELSIFIENSVKENKNNII